MLAASDEFWDFVAAQFNLRSRHQKLTHGDGSMAQPDFPSAAGTSLRDLEVS